jgi:hypothetical protein
MHERHVGPDCGLDGEPMENSEAQIGGEIQRCIEKSYGVVG